MDILLSDKIKDVIEHAVEKNRGRYVGASSIGHPCERKIWYQYKDYKQENSAKLKLTFDLGHRIESLILDYLEKSDIRVRRPLESNNNLFCADLDFTTFSGHMDAIIEIPDKGIIAVLDIKTAKASSFQKFVKHGLREWNMQYYAQLQAYMGMTGIKLAVLLALNKDTSDLHEEWFRFDSSYYEELRTKAMRIAEDDEVPPERINKNPCFYLCSMCGYKKVCHSEEK